MCFAGRNEQDHRRGLRLRDLLRDRVQGLFCILLHRHTLLEEAIHLIDLAQGKLGSARTFSHNINISLPAHLVRDSGWISPVTGAHRDRYLRIGEEQPRNPRREENGPDMLVPDASLLLDSLSMDEPLHPLSHAAKPECPLRESKRMARVPAHMEARPECSRIGAPELVGPVSMNGVNVNGGSDRLATESVRRRTRRTGTARAWCRGSPRSW